MAPPCGITGSLQLMFIKNVYEKKAFSYRFTWWEGSFSWIKCFFMSNLTFNVYLEKIKFVNPCLCRIFIVKSDVFILLIKSFNKNHKQMF